MKRNLVIALLLCIVCLFSACSGMGVHVCTEDWYIPPYSPPKNGVSESDEHFSCIEYPMIYVTPEEYGCFFKKYGSDDILLTSAEIALFGNLDRAVTTGSSLAQMSYSIVDENGVAFDLTVSHQDLRNGKMPEADPLEDPSFTDLRQSNGGAGRDLFLENAMYRYYTESNNLHVIYWENRGFRYSLSFELDAPYPQGGKETIVSKLLSRETAEDTIRYLQGSIGDK